MPVITKISVDKVAAARKTPAPYLLVNGSHNRNIVKV